MSNRQVVDPDNQPIARLYSAGELGLLGLDVQRRREQR